MTLRSGRQPVTEQQALWLKFDDELVRAARRAAREAERVDHLVRAAGGEEAKHRSADAVHATRQLRDCLEIDRAKHKRRL